MSDLAEYIAALAFSSVAHPYGHVNEGYKYDTPMTIHWDKGTEHWNPRQELTPQEKTNIHGGGFNFQDQIANAGEGDFRSKMALANAVYKLLYANKIGYRNTILKDYSKDDINLMEQNSGNPRVKELLLASVLGDLYKWKNPDSRLGSEFAVIDGAPGIKLNYQW